MTAGRALIGIDRGPLGAAPTGIPVYARMLLAAMSIQRTDWEFEGFSLGGWKSIEPGLFPDPSRLAERRADNARRWLTGAALGVPVLAELRRRARELRFRLERRPPLDLFYAMNFVPPGVIGCPVVPLVHDLFHLESPEEVHPARRRVLCRLSKVLRHAPRVQAVSNATAARIVHHFGVPLSRIDIVPPMLRPIFLSPPDLLRLEPLLLQPGSYWLAVGMGEKRKNLAFLVRLFERFPQLCTPRHPLVVTGLPSRRGDPPDKGMAAMLHDKRLRHLGFVTTRDLSALYGGATALLVPSKHEGFGIPIIEGLAAGTHVIAAANSALPEASGGHARMARLSDADEWACALTDAREQPRDAEAVDAGRAHAARFTADRSAALAISSLERVLSTP